MTVSGLAIIMFFVALVIIPCVVHFGEVVEKYFRSGQSEQAVTNMSVTISFDLVPMINKLRLDGATIRILGDDGAYLAYERSFVNMLFHPIRTLKSLYFEFSISRWLSKGASVHYLFLNPTASQELRLKKLTARLGAKFQVTKLGDIADKDKEKVKKILERFETLHPTLIETNDGNAFWVEYHHPKESTIAYATKFVSPLAINKSSEKEEFEVYNRQFEALKPYELSLAA